MIRLISPLQKREVEENGKWKMENGVGACPHIKEYFFSMIQRRIC